MVMAPGGRRRKKRKSKNVLEAYSGEGMTRSRMEVMACSEDEATDRELC